MGISQKLKWQLVVYVWYRGNLPRVNPAKVCILFLCLPSRATLMTFNPQMADNYNQLQNYFVTLRKHLKWLKHRWNSFGILLLLLLLIFPTVYLVAPVADVFRQSLAALRGFYASVQRCCHRSNPWEYNCCSRMRPPSNTPSQLVVVVVLRLLHYCCI